MRVFVDRKGALHVGRERHPLPCTISGIKIELKRGALWLNGVECNAGARIRVYTGRAKHHEVLSCVRVGEERIHGLCRLCANCDECKDCLLCSNCRACIRCRELQGCFGCYRYRNETRRSNLITVRHTRKGTRYYFQTMNVLLAWRGGKYRFGEFDVFRKVKRIRHTRCFHLESAPEQKTGLMVRLRGSRRWEPCNRSCVHIPPPSERRAAYEERVREKQERERLEERHRPAGVEMTRRACGGDAPEGCVALALSLLIAREKNRPTQALEADFERACRQHRAEKERRCAEAAALALTQKICRGNAPEDCVALAVSFVEAKERGGSAEQERRAFLGACQRYLDRLEAERVEEIRRRAVEEYQEEQRRREERAREESGPSWWDRFTASWASAFRVSHTDYDDNGNAYWVSYVKE